MAKDYYEVLGVDRSADADQIKKAYRKLAMQFHPDKNPGNQEAEEKFKEAAQAYEILSNPEKRAQYDRFGHSAFQGGAGGGGFQNAEDIFSQFGDLFSDFFGGGMDSRSSRRSGPQRGADLRYRLEIQLEDVVKGTKKEIKFDTEENCEACSGSGAEKGSSPVTCPTCGGRGQVVRSQGFFQMASTCPQCRGEGQLIKNPCKQCSGEARVRARRRIEVDIPPGVDSGTRLRVSGEGEGGYRGGPPGDLFVELMVAEDSRFERDGVDLHTSTPVPYLSLILGGEIEIATVTGRQKIKIPKGSQPGEKIRLVGEGVPSLRGSRRGDLYCLLKVSLPESVSKEEEKLLRQLADLQGLKVGSAKNKFF